MQEIDRLKVSHAKDVIYNADTGSILPSLSTAHAVTNEDLKNIIKDDVSAGSTRSPPPLLKGSSTIKDYVSFISEK